MKKNYKKNSLNDSKYMSRIVSGASIKHVRFIFISLLLMYVLVMIAFYFSHYTFLTCVDINNAQLCGVGDIDRGAISTKDTGYYLYGLSDANGRFSYEKI